MWLVDAEGKAQLHTVTVGRYLTGKVIVSAGLNGGEKVVIAGGQLLHPGARVEIVENTYKTPTTGTQP
ncbi:Multidrug resistance protein MdtA precursor [compost metagenome]